MRISQNIFQIVLGDIRVTGHKGQLKLDKSSIPRRRKSVVILNSEQNENRKRARSRLEGEDYEDEKEENILLGFPEVQLTQRIKSRRSSEVDHSQSFAAEKSKPSKSKPLRLKHALRRPERLSNTKNARND